MFSTLASGSESSQTSQPDQSFSLAFGQPPLFDSLLKEKVFFAKNLVATSLNRFPNSAPLRICAIQLAALSSPTLENARTVYKGFIEKGK